MSALAVVGRTKVEQELIAAPTQPPLQEPPDSSYPPFKGGPPRTSRVKRPLLSPPERSEKAGGAPLCLSPRTSAKSALANSRPLLTSSDFTVHEIMPGPAMFPDYIFTRMGPDDREQRSSCRRWLADNLFLVCTLLGVTGGIVLGKSFSNQHCK